MRTSKMCAVAAIFAGIATAHADDSTYTVVEEKDHSFGSVRSRITLEIEAPQATTERDKLQAMMSAAVDRHRKDWPDAISARLWNSYGNDFVIQNSIDYAPDGCGWAGTDCDQPIWTDLHKGTIPEDLIAWGAPTKGEEEAAADKVCREDLQCWAGKHSFAAILKCQPLIEAHAKYDYDWTDGWFGSKLERVRWDDREAGSLSYSGNKVKFQNGFGAWQHMTYWCHYNPSTEAVRVSVHGRE